MTNTWKSNEVVLAEAPTYDHKFHRFRPNIWKSGKYKNRILKQGEYKIKTENAGLFYRRTELTNFFEIECIYFYSSTAKQIFKISNTNLKKNGSVLLYLNISGLDILILCLVGVLCLLDTKKQHKMSIMSFFLTSRQKK